VLHQRRGGGQSQFSALLELDAKSDRVQMALTYATENLGRDLSVDALAGVARLSPRQFSRVLREETGQSPAKAIERLRVEAARLMMETTRHPIEIIARETGFGDRERMRQAFLRAFGQPPQAIQRTSAASPKSARPFAMRLAASTPRPLRTRSTVASLTPAALATSAMLVLRRGFEGVDKEDSRS